MPPLLPSPGDQQYGRRHAHANRAAACLRQLVSAPNGGRVELPISRHAGGIDLPLSSCQFSERVLAADLGRPNGREDHHHKKICTAPRASHNNNPVTLLSVGLQRPSHLLGVTFSIGEAYAGLRFSVAAVRATPQHKIGSENHIIADPHI